MPTNKIFKVEYLRQLVNFLSVTRQNPCKKRLILDLRYINKHVYLTIQECCKTLVLKKMQFLYF